MEEWRKTPALKLRQRLGVEAPVTRGGLLHSPVSVSRPIRSTRVPSRLGPEDVEGAGKGKRDDDEGGGVRRGSRVRGAVVVLLGSARSRRRRGGGRRRPWHGPR